MNEIWDNTSEELRPIIEQLYKNLFDEDKKFASIEGFTNVVDYGITRFKGVDCRKIDITYNGKKFELGIFNYIRENGNTIGIRNGESDSNYIQYVLDKFIMLIDDKVNFKHDGVITGTSGKTKQACLDFFDLNAPNLVVYKGNQRSINLGSLDLNFKFEDDDFQKWFSSFLKYAVLRNEFKNDRKSVKITNFKDFVEAYKIHIDGNNEIDQKFKINEAKPTYAWLVDDIVFEDMTCHYELIVRNKDCVGVEIHFEDQKRKEFSQRLRDKLPEKAIWNNQHRAGKSIAYSETFRFSDSDIFEKVDVALLYLDAHLAKDIRRMVNGKYLLSEFEELFKRYLEKVIPNSASLYASAMVTINALGKESNILDESIYAIQDSERYSKFIDILKNDLGYKTVNDRRNNTPQSVLKKYQEFLKTFTTTNDKTDQKINYMGLNQILYGPPGTGKTYNTINKALSILEYKSLEEIASEKRSDLKKRFESYIKNGQIVFTTFHQSMSYEDFIEGIKPLKPEEEDEFVRYDIQEGIFKQVCRKALKEFYQKGTNDETFERLNSFENAWNDLLENVQRSIGNNQVFPLKTKSGQEMDAFEISDRGNLYLRPQYIGAKDYTVSHDRTRKLFEVFRNLDTLNNIDKKFRSVIGGANSTAYWSVLNYIINWLNENPTLLNVSTQVDISDELVKFDNKIVKENIESSVLNFVIIIDEINRGNVSQIFGELITLIEEDKRLGKDEALEITLPYSKEKFGVPPNLYIIGTMNTADRSVEALDTALRRRFNFKELMPDSKVVLKKGFEDFPRAGIMKKLNDRIELLLDRNHTLGHAYFIKADFKSSFENEIIPLLQEYFYNDCGKIGLILGKGFVREKTIYGSALTNSILADFPTRNEAYVTKTYELIPFEELDFATAIESLLSS